jgi:hypothetical protein
VLHNCSLYFIALKSQIVLFALTVAWGDEKIVSKGCCCANAQVLNQIKLALIDIEVSFEMFVG